VKFAPASFIRATSTAKVAKLKLERQLRKFAAAK
jgi:hypothetical protein